MWRSIAALFVVAAAASAAHAQSTRYPPDPKDPDREAARHSKVWEDALDPERAPYDDLVRTAQRLKDDNTPKDRQDAIAHLDTAVKLMPNRPEAYALRGELRLAMRDYAACADDLAAAEAHEPSDENIDRARERLELGVCEARAGRFPEAERTLARAASMQSARGGEAWLRLGEVRIALGKLDEAIGALDTAAETGDSTAPFTHYLLALAYDRARLPGDAADHMIEGFRSERPSFSAIENPIQPLLGVGEREYMLALGYLYAQPRPEYALLYFRRFIALAPQSPWRRRAEEHLRELAAVELPQTVNRQGGNAAIDVDAVRGALAKVMPQIRSCMAKLPATVLEVKVTRDGPRSPPSRDRARYPLPAQAISVQDTLELADGVARDEIDAAQRCLEPLVDRAGLPVPKDRDTYYAVSFYAISP
ncbi:MAG TPA: tetratricopeptide repeat protein [Kofleriaceae bacterium]|nr:tetratricopeptide repeat protein [Kofleriaceae bacterium]